MRIRSLRYLWVLASFAPGVAFGQSAIERHVWQDKRAFEPMSRTAASITGPIRLSGNSKFASPGSKMTLTFGNGKSVELTSVGGMWSEWDIGSSDKITAEVYRLKTDPGALKANNTLCGNGKDERSRFIVFFEDSLPGETPFLGSAVFSSRTPPKSIMSPGLCGTFNFYTE